MFDVHHGLCETEEWVYAVRCVLFPLQVITVLINAECVIMYIISIILGLFIQLKQQHFCDQIFPANDQLKRGVFQCMTARTLVESTQRRQ